VRNRIVLSLFVVGCVAGLSADATPYLLLQKPTLSRTQIAFVYAGDLWTVPREGGDAQRLTSGAGTETNPIFSPDGSTIAFTGEYDGNVDVYTVPATGGVPKRLTWHPAPDTALGWSPDGKQILFSSNRDWKRIRRRSSCGRSSRHTAPSRSNWRMRELESWRIGDC